MKISVFVLIMFISFKAYSYSPWGPSGEVFNKSLFYFELMGGTILPSMNFDGNEFVGNSSDIVFTKTGGIVLRCQFAKVLSIASLISYREQGVSLSESNYLLNTKNINLFVPIEFDYNVFKLKSKTHPMLILFAGPYVANNIGGEYSSSGSYYPISANELTKWDYGVEGGLGFRIPIFSADGRSNISFKVSYYNGLKNTFPKYISGYNEDEMNQFMLSQTGKRLNRGIRISIGYEFSLEKREVTTFTAGGDGKRTYKRYINIK